MTDITLKSLAEEIHTTVNILIQKFADAGIYKTENDIISSQEKEKLFLYLNTNTSINSNQLILKRKTRSTLNIAGIGGKSKSVQIEVRQKRTYIKEYHNDHYNEEEIQKHQKEKQESIELKHKKNHDDHNKLNQLIKPKKILNNVDKNKDELLDNKKSLHPKTNKYLNTEPSEKNKRKSENAEIKRKVENDARIKSEKHTRISNEKTRRLVELKFNHWENMKNNPDNNYHITTFQHARQAEDDNDLEVEITRVRNLKIPRPKKSNKHSEAKIDREEAKAVGKNNKNHKLRKISTLQQSFNKPSQSINRNVVIGETIAISELANKMAVKSSQVIKILMKMGSMATINQLIDQETAQLVAEEMGHKVILRHENELETAIMHDRDIGLNIEAKFRAPVVTIMGHVDHGKTSLLDYIRSTKIAAKEAGGITQHIGAYHVETDNGMITFLDTPGHAAFTAMRARGVQATDIVILVVAADDSVMPQTIEAIQHAKAANVPVVVAINKIDKTGVDPDRVKHELSNYGIIPEEWGGENIFVNVSAKTGNGIDNLLQALLLQAEIMELTAIYDKMASGVVIESCLDKGRGPVATILVREGTLNKGDIVLCGFEYGRVRAMRDELGYELMHAGPSIPVEILGLSGVPSAGDKMTVVRDEKKARDVALYRQGKFREIKLARQQKSKLENMFATINEGELCELNIVIKADVKGSVEAIVESLINLSTKEIQVKIIGSGVGGITETDATLAAASNAIIIGFNVRADNAAKRIIENENLDLHYYSVIYDLINEIKTAMNGMLSPEHKQQILGLAEVRDIFKSPKFGLIAGCMVIEGIIKHHNPIRILRNNIVIYEGKLESLRRFKDDIQEVRNGMECGIGVKNYNDIQVGDIIEVFEMIEIKRTINQ